jgi:hypothetical protein
MATSSPPTKRFVEILDLPQAEHLKRIVGILRKFSFAIDRSQMGAGKSYVAGSVADLLKFERIVVVCPATMEGEWRAILNGERLAKPIESLKAPPLIMSYEMLRSKRHRPIVAAAPEELAEKVIFIPASGINSTPEISTLSHGLLTVSQTSSLIFYPSSLLHEYVASRTLFIFDESHKAKNPSAATHDAVSTVIRTVYSSGGNSRVMLLSGTLFDKEKHALGLAHLLGVSTTSDMSTHNRSLQTVVLTGIKDIMKFIKTDIQCLPDSAPDPDYTGGHRISDTTSAKLVAYNLMIQVVIPAISSAIDTPPEVIARTRDGTHNPIKTSKAVLDCSNLFATLTHIEAEALRIAIKRLQKAVSYNSHTRQVSMGGKSAANWGEITLARVEIEAAKRGAFLRTTLETLKQQPNVKIVIGFNYTESVHVTAAAIRASGIIPASSVVTLTGDTPKRSRTTIMEQFNAEGPDSLQVMVANMKIISHGVSLDDQIGTRPRFVLASPSYFAIDQHQFVRRFYRRNTQGMVKVKFVYGNVSEQEAAGETLDKTSLREDHVLASLARKAQVLRDTSGQEGNSPTIASPCKNIVYADDYPSDWEDEDDEEEELK